MPKQKRLKGVHLAKGLEYKGKFPAKAKFVYGESKWDGLRGFAYKGKMYSSSGVRVVNAPQIEKMLALLPKTMHNNIMDGEFFYKNCRTTLGIVKTQTPDHPLRDKLQFLTFDLVSLEEWEAKKGTVPLKRRKVNLYVTLHKMGIRFIKKHGDKKEKPIKLLKHKVLPPTDEAVQKFHKKNCKLGREGTFIKDPKSVYSFKKNRDWQKLKPYRESDMEIIKVKEGKGKHKGRLGGVRVKGVIDGVKVETFCGGGFKDHEREKYWKWHKQGKLVGKIVEMKHEGITKNKAVRFPGFRRIHPEKNDGKD